MPNTACTKPNGPTIKGSPAMYARTFSKFSGLILVAMTLGACVATTGGDVPATGTSSIGSATTNVSPIANATAAPQAATNIQLAIAARTGGDYGTAIRMLRSHISRNPDDATAMIELGETLHEAGAYDEAIEVFDYAKSYAQGDPVVHTGLGRSQLAMRRPADALAAFGKVLEKNPHDIVALNGRGVALDMQGDHAGAQVAYDAALAQRPNNHLVESNLALSYLLEDRYNDAIEILERLSLDRDSTVRIRQNLALAYGLRGDTNIASQVARLDLDPEMVENNLRYYEIIRGVGAPQLRSAPLVSR